MDKAANDPFEISRRHRFSPVRCYLSLRRALEPHWYRYFWQADPWTNLRCEALWLRIECTAEESEQLQELESIPSAVTAEHARDLYWLARHASASGDIVEIGADQGKSTIALSWGARRNQNVMRVHSVDPFVGGDTTTGKERIELFGRNLIKFGVDNVSLHQMSGGEYHREGPHQVSVLFVDAAHDYLNSRFDFLRWRESISAGGYLVAHDVDNYVWGPGTRKAFFDFVLNDPRFVLVHHADNLAIAQRISH